MAELFSYSLVILYLTVFIQAKSRTAFYAVLAFAVTLGYGYTSAYDSHSAWVVHSMYAAIYLITIYFMLQDKEVRYKTCIAMLLSATANAVMVLMIALFYLIGFNWEPIASCYIYGISAINLYIILTVYKRAKHGQDDNAIAKFRLVPDPYLSGVQVYSKKDKRGRATC